MFVKTTRRDVIKRLRERINVQYAAEYWRDKRQKILSGLAHLDLNTCDLEEVDKAMGHRSWTSLTCSICEKEVDAVVEGTPNNGIPVRICESCLVNLTQTIRCKSNT